MNFAALLDSVCMYIHHVAHIVVRTAGLCLYAMCLRMWYGTTIVQRTSSTLVMNTTMC